MPPELVGERVDRASALLLGVSRREAQRLIEQGDLLVNDEQIEKSRRLRRGDEIMAGVPVALDARPTPEPMELAIRHVDDDLIVVAKPAGLVVHPGAGHEHGTLVNGLLAAYPEIAGVGDVLRPGIVHRLDRETSGLMMVARSERAYPRLVEALAAREIERRYLVLVWGRMDARRGVIDAPIGRSPLRRTRMAVRGTGKPARTAYEVAEELAAPEVSLLSCRLETGRTHQIRVHCAAIGHPVVGDATYGGRRQPLVLDRPFLHAITLELVHPFTGERLCFEEPLPPDLDAVLVELRRSR